MTSDRSHLPRKIPRREFLKLAAAGAVGALAGCCPTLPKTGDLALVGGTLIDGTGADPLLDAAVLIREGRIAAVGTVAQVKASETARVIDVGGATVLPGFINAHVHGSYDEDTLKAWARGGVTTVRDMATGQPVKDAFAFRDGLRDDLQCARLVAAGRMVTVPDGYPIARWGVDSITVTSPEDARQKVDQLLDDGADFVKIPLESGAIFGFSMPMLSPEETAAIVETAHARGAWVSAHVSVTRDLEKALDAGVDDIAHMVTDKLPDELAARVVESDTYWVPTIELWKGVGYGLGAHVVDNLRRFVEAGGKVALGTDYAGAPNVDFDLGMPIHEIEWMQEAGMTPLQIVVAATKHAAHVCNLGQEFGTLEVGKIADILVVDGDPLEDIHALTRTKMVFREGVSV
jgi:imidazolonepropionase-like amidohydrolase